MLIRWIHDLNQCAGLFLVIIAFAVSSIARNLSKLTLEVECLHEDYDRVTEAHERHHWNMERKRDDMVAAAMEKPQTAKDVV